MIKVFSPETFNDYDRNDIYGCIYNNTEHFYTLDLDKFNKTITEDYSDYINTTWASPSAFIDDMISRGIIEIINSLYEIIDYDSFFANLKTWFNISRYSDRYYDSLGIDITKYGDVYIDITAFNMWALDNDEYFKDSFSSDRWINKLIKAKIIGKTTNARILKPTKFKTELKNVLVTTYYTGRGNKKKQHSLNRDQLIEEMFRARAAGINVVYDIEQPLLFYFFKAAEERLPEYHFEFNGMFPYKNNGELVYADLENVRGVLDKDTIEGYTLFGVVERVETMYFLDYTKFNTAVTNDASARGIVLPDEVSPAEFIAEQVAAGVLIDVTNTEYGKLPGVTTRYRILNGAVFPTNYSVYRIGANIVDLIDGNGDMVLRPTSCELQVEINSAWTLTLQHPYDEDYRDSFIQKGCVIAITGKVAREQTFTNQLFRVYDVQNTFSGVEVTGYPVAMESAFECPIDNLYYEDRTAIEVAQSLTGLYPEKYLIDTNIQNGSASIYAQNSNLQEVLAGNDEATFINTYGGEIIYDNYIYRIPAQAGRDVSAAKDYMIEYKSNMKGITIQENTYDVVTRVYPTSSEGYNFLSVRAAFKEYYDLFGSLTMTIVTGYYFQWFHLLDYVGMVEQHTVGASIKNRCKKFLDAIIKDKLVKKITDLEGHVVEFDEDVDCLIHIKVSNQLRNAASAGVYANSLANSSYPSKFISELKELNSQLLAKEFVDTATETVNMNQWNQVPKYVNSDTIYNYPFVHARSISHDEVQLIEEYDENNDVSKNDTMIAVEEAKAAITAKVQELSQYYIKRAHEGKWNHKKRIKTKSQTIQYTGEDALTHIHTSKYNPRTDRIQLPYGYILYSYKDAIAYLKQVAVKSWCTDQNEAEIFCQAIEEGFKWCEKTEIAKWMWHTKDKKRYFGTKNRSDYVKYGKYHIDNKWYWFDKDGYVDMTPEDLSEYKWESEEYEVNKIDKDGNVEYEDDGVTPKKEKKTRYRYQNEKGDYLKNQWIEESTTRHYYVQSDGYRKTFKVENGKDKDGNVVYKEMDYDDGQWSFKPNEKDGSTFKLSGYSYGNHEKGYYPSGQFMYIKEYKGWYWFCSKAEGNDKGYLQGNYMSDATWTWKKFKKGWRYTDGKNSYLWGQWAKIDGKWYWFSTKGGYADETVDDFSENSKSFKTGDKEPTVDYNREGVGGSSSDDSVASDDAEYNDNRDGVKAWIQDNFIKELKKAILLEHNNLWDVLFNRLYIAAESDLSQLRNESMSVEVDFELLQNYDGYQNLTFLNDLYLGDYVHVRSTLHNFDGDLRVVGMTYDCITNRPKTMTLGYPTNSFIKRQAMMNPNGTVKFNAPSGVAVNDYVTKDPDTGNDNNRTILVNRYIESGYGDNIEDGSTTEPYIPV